jgi:hypothetical protein
MLNRLCVYNTHESGVLGESVIWVGVMQGLVRNPLM